jgi:hypothetical protein
MPPSPRLPTFRKKTGFLTSLLEAVSCAGEKVGTVDDTVTATLKRVGEYLSVCQEQGIEASPL